jgi:hypothetical protein
VSNPKAVAGSGRGLRDISVTGSTYAANVTSLDAARFHLIFDKRGRLSFEEASRMLAMARENVTLSLQAFSGESRAWLHSKLSGASTCGT